MSPAPKKAGLQEIMKLEIRRIRKDGGTQGRIVIDEAIVKEYATLMKVGVVFPPIRTWFDGKDYWLSDGYQRVAAAESAGLAKIDAEILRGSLQDAQWDSYAANSSHGLRRTRADIELTMSRALDHPMGSQLSGREIARHLNIPETTLRRWQKSRSAPNGADTSRIAVRGGKTYSIETANIKKAAEKRRKHSRSPEDLRGEFNQLREMASPEARLLLVILGTWLFDGSPGTVCLDRIEETVKEFRSSSQQKSSRNKVNKTVGPRNHV